MSRRLLVTQNILDGPDPALNRPITTITIQELDIAASDVLSVFNHAKPIGISPGYSVTRKLISLAIADDKNCRIIEFSQPKNKRTNGKPSSASKPETLSPVHKPDVLPGRQKLQDHIFCRTAGDIFAFDMGPLAMSLYCDLGGLHITNAIDIHSAFSAVDSKPLTGIQTVLGDSDSVKINAKNVTDVFSNPIYDNEHRNCIIDLAQRAWVSQFLVRSGNGAEMFDKVKRIDTKKLDSSHLRIIAKIANDALRLSQMKPLQTTHHFDQSLDDKTNLTKLNSLYFQNRLRSNQNVIMDVTGPAGNFSISGVMGAVIGRSGNVMTDGNLEVGKVITSVTSIDRDDSTTAEAQRSATILRILQGTEKLDESPWIQNIWLPDDGLLVWPKKWSESATQAVQQSPPTSTPRLNPSQQRAVSYMLSSRDNNRITLIQGPPGTGKTSVIADFVQRYIRRLDGGIWLVAQSNVAVKNIAEKLASIGFLNWRLLVSKGFHLGWHEHLYHNHKIQNNIIRSDSFRYSNKSNLEDCQVILCTLSMLSNPHISKFTKEIPLKTIVVDEASQIEVGNYLSVLTNFKHSLHKLCFIGDNKQLPPFGQENLQDLQSIFEISHLQKQAIVLDVQYRMPPQIGDIISELVYESKLKSNPSHPIMKGTTACYFVEALGKEKPMGPTSFMNEAEAHQILHIARKLQEQDRNYRIITPYESQTKYIENLMKAKGLKWGDKCFNVDSFQGNEDDFIIISIVRTSHLGFLNDLRRTNVMLSRCKKGMFIVSTHSFLTNIAKDSLIGQFVEKVSNPTWLTLEDVQGEKFWKNKF